MLDAIFVFLKRFSTSPAAIFLFISLAGAIYVANNVAPTYYSEKTIFQTKFNEEGILTYNQRGENIPILEFVEIAKSPLRQDVLAESKTRPEVMRQWVVEEVMIDGEMRQQYALLQVKSHYGVWSLLPALVAILMCLLTYEPIISLLSGVVVAAFMMSRFDIVDGVLVPSLATHSAAGILVLYLWLLGGLMGVWSKTGAARAFASFMVKHFVRGPKTAKLIGWILGVLFFQGGTMSTVLVGTSVKPIADEHKVSHEELSYVVDSTASPIATILPFNAWPLYVQSFIFLPGVAFLATETDRINFFFQSVAINFYSMFAVLGTFLLCMDKLQFSGPIMRRAFRRARDTGEMDAPNAAPLSAKELQDTSSPAGYQANILEFVIPIGLLIFIAIGTFIFLGTPKVNWAFGAALFSAAFMALAKGMSLRDLIDGFSVGLKSVVAASVVLLLAITIGRLSAEVGGGQYLISLLGDRLPFWILPLCLQLLTMVISFSTGTTWGTYAIAFPLIMPLAWATAMGQGLANPELYLLVCFATVLNGSVYGDQCSPISDTTVLSSMATGCDLMDHVKTQIFPATLAAILAAFGWLAMVLIFNQPI